MQPSQFPVAIYLLCVPLLAVLPDRIGGHDFARVSQVALCLTCALILVADVRKARSVLDLRLGCAVGLVLALAIASTLHAPDTAIAARELALFAGMAVVALVTSRLNDAVIAPSVTCSVAGAAYVAVILFVVVLTYLSGERLNRADLFIGYDNYRLFNHVQTVALPLSVLGVTVLKPRTWVRAVAWFAAIGGFALLFLVAGRGTLLGIAAGAVAVAIGFRRDSVAILTNLVLTAVLGLLLSWVSFSWVPQLAGLTLQDSSSYSSGRLTSDEARFFLWRIAIAQVEQSPWLGIGPMHYAHDLNAKAAHPHNIYLQIAAEWGVLLLLVVLAVGALALRKFALAIRRCAEPQRRNCGIGLFLACIAIAVDGSFSGNFVMPVSQVWIAFAIGWAMAVTRADHAMRCTDRSAQAPAFSANRAGAIALLVSQLWLAWSVWPEVRHLEKHVQQAMERAPSAKTNPRFWSHGWF